MFELLTVIDELPSGKAGGTDLWTYEAVQVIAHHDKLLGRWLDIFNRCLNEGKLPEEWTSSSIIPLPKKGDPTNPGNWRGIALMSAPLKVLLRCLAPDVTG